MIGSELSLNRKQTKLIEHLSSFCKEIISFFLSLFCRVRMDSWSFSSGTVLPNGKDALKQTVSNHRYLSTLIFCRPFPVFNLSESPFFNTPDIHWLVITGIVGLGMGDQGQISTYVFKNKIKNYEFELFIRKNLSFIFLGKENRRLF